MAGDWIKMRVNLVTHPKVMAIAEFLSGEAEYQEWSTLSSFMPAYGGSDEDHRNERYAALRVTRYVTVCGLLRFWGYANEHARNEFIEFASLGDIDEVVQIPCFGKAMAQVEWVREAADKTGLELPNFAEFNAVAAERSSGAERQKRYRERKKASSVTDDGDVTRDVTVTPREEKRREEEKEEIHMSGKPDSASEIIEYLNQKSGRSFRNVKANTDLIHARLREGATADELKAVIDVKVKAWNNDPKMAEYLRPETLFGARKFAQYAGQINGHGRRADEDARFEN